MQAEIDTSRRQRRNFLLTLAAVMTGIGLLIVLLLGFSYRDTGRAAETRADNLALILKSGLDASLRRVDADVQEIAGALASDGRRAQSGGRHDQEILALLGTHLRNFPEVAAFSVVDAEGVVRYSSDPAAAPLANVADRPHFQKLRDDPLSGLVFSAVIMSRSTAKPAIAVGHALRGDDGRFAGAVFALLDLAFFERMFDSLDIGARGLITIRRSDDTRLVLRRPSVPETLNRPLSGEHPVGRRILSGESRGIERFAAETDGVARIYAFRTLDHYPFYVLVGFADEDIYAGWRGRALGAVSVFALGFAVLALLALRLRRSEEREAEAALAVADRERRLEVNENKLDEVMDVARMGDWEYCADTGQFRVGRSFGRVLGRADEAAAAGELSTPAFTARFLHAEDAGIVGVNIARAMAEADPTRTYAANARLIDRDGMPRWVMARFHYLPPNEAQGARLAGTIIDIHENHQAGEELAKLALVARETTNAIVIADAAQRIEWVNAGFTRRTGREAGEVAGLALLDVLAGPTSSPATLAALRERMGRGEAVRAEFLNAGRAGAPYWADCQIQPVWGSDGRLARFIAVLADVTERKRAEQALSAVSTLREAILDGAAYSIIATGTDGVITVFNRAAERMLGYGAAEMIGRETPERVHDRAEVAARAQELSRELGEPVLPGFDAFVIKARLGLPDEHEWTYVRKDGGRFPVMLTVTALRDENAQITGYLGIAADISERKAAEASLRASEERFRSLTEMSSDWYWEQDAEFRFTRISAGDEAGRAIRQAALGKRRWEQAIDADDPAWAAHRALLEAHRPFRNFEYRARSSRESSEWRWFVISGEPVFAADGRFAGYRGVASDITERKRAEERLLLLASAFQNSGEALMITDRENTIIEVNPAFTRLTGYAAEEMRGRSPGMLASGRTSAAQYQAMWTGIRERGFWQGEIWDRRKDGKIYPKLLTISVVRDPAGAILYHIASFADISEQKASEEKVRYLAHHDALTGLPNRLNLHGRLEQALAVARREQQQVAVMFIDLDRFKVINDTLGHQVGDGLLIDVAKRLQHSVRDSDIVARLGGDEFVVVVTGVAAEVAAAHVADKILASLAQPYQVLGYELHSTPSIGIGVFPADGADVDALMKNADTAMYHAKAQGRNNYQFFTAAMTEAAGERLALENSLRTALKLGQFRLEYQPQVRYGDGRVFGLEALLRWEHPEQGLVPPLKFVPVAEDTGLIVALGDWVLDEACRQLRVWRDQGLAGMRVAVNLSAHQLRQSGFAERVGDVLARHGLAGADLELELTESAAMANPADTIEIFESLRAMGVALSIDDFGTGYSSLSYLKMLPLDRLKLDRSFVKDIEVDPDDAAICAATIALAHNLDIEVVAEGVETEKQRDFLARLGCDGMQGYLFSRPLAAPAAADFIRAAAAR